MFNLNLDYFLLVFGSSLGVIQIAAAWSGLNGLLFIRYKGLSALIGVVLFAVSMAWFVLVGDPEKPGDIYGIQGASQFGLFLAGAAAATLATALLASLLQAGQPQVPARGDGMDALRSATLVSALKARFAKPPTKAP